MKAMGNLKWDKIRDWLAEAGSVCSGYYVDYQELRVSRPKLQPGRQFDQPRHAVKTDPAKGRLVSNGEF
ncbi:hypothetical protein QD460_20680 [Rhizobium jaguaris]|uniref:hypothetical protein n=1 Tax=Rhizobium jaguaris TaxID=1312183 RepID=UPI0039BEFFBF